MKRVFYHGTTQANWELIQASGFLKAPYLTTELSIAQEYADAASEDQSEKPFTPVVLVVTRIPTAWLHCDHPALAEPVAPPHLTGAELDNRVSRSLGQYKRHKPNCYDPETDTVSVRDEDYMVSLRTVYSVRCIHNVPLAHLNLYERTSSR